MKRRTPDFRDGNELDTARVARWRVMLTPYPLKFQAPLLRRHGESLRYWHNDYRYASKVSRGDAVFLSSVSARLAHDVLQVLFVMNECYCPGDGANLSYTRNFTIKPPSLESRLTAALYPALSDGRRTTRNTRPLAR